MARTRLKSKGRQETGYFIRIPWLLFDHPDFASLSGSALKVLLGLIRQFRGANNGDLSASFGQAKKWGIGSRTSLVKALDELRVKRWIVRTREGHFTNPGGRCALYAITWQPVNDCPGKDLEHQPTNRPLRSLSLEKNKTPGTESGLGCVQKMDAQPEIDHESQPTAYRMCTHEGG